MLAPLTGEPKKRLFAAYDLEWWPKTLELRMAGIWDGERYRFYRTMAEFLRGELVDRNRNRILFAHAGGSFDVQFVLQELINWPDYKVEAIFSGSSAVIVKVRKGDYLWTFGDSYFLLRDKLEKIGKWIGFEKLDKAAIYSENWDELKTYNERDCRILYMAIDALQEELLELGGELKATLASCAMALFKRRFLTRTIRTSASLNLECNRSYYASRVEVFRRECIEANYYDINSSFPFSMSFPQPGDLIGVDRVVSDDPEALFIADATVEVKECFLPPLPYRDKNWRVLFPTGVWRSRFDVADLRLLEETGHRILKVHEVYHFDAFDDLSAYVEELYERKRTSEGFAREAYKLLLNALYGKFGEKPEKSKILINPASTYCPHNGQHEDDECLKMIIPGVWEVSEIATIPHAHVPISSHITALSRRWLYHYLSKCRDIYYCDTDSVICGPLDRFKTSDHLGGLKLEKTIHRGHFLAPKLYAVRSKEADKEGNHLNVRSKGFRRLGYDAEGKRKSDGATYEDFTALAEGREFQFERMLSVKESLRRGDSRYKVQQAILRKKAHLRNPKRFVFPDGNTRPWTMAEIEARGDAPKEG